MWVGNWPGTWQNRDWNAWRSVTTHWQVQPGCIFTRHHHCDTYKYKMSLEERAKIIKAVRGCTLCLEWMGRHQQDKCTIAFEGSLLPKCYEGRTVNCVTKDTTCWYIMVDWLTIKLWVALELRRTRILYSQETLNAGCESKHWRTDEY